MATGPWTGWRVSFFPNAAAAHLILWIFLQVLDWHSSRGVDAGRSNLGVVKLYVLMPSSNLSKLVLGEPTEAWSPLLLLVPLVLGLDKVNPRYLPSLRATFTFPQSLGIAGGKPGASTYLVGVQDDQAMYLDPHETQQVVPVTQEK